MAGSPGWRLVSSQAQACWRWPVPVLLLEPSRPWVWGEQLGHGASSLPPRVGLGHFLCCPKEAWSGGTPLWPPRWAWARRQCPLLCVACWEGLLSCCRAGPRHSGQALLPLTAAPGPQQFGGDDVRAHPGVANARRKQADQVTWTGRDGRAPGDPPKSRDFLLRMLSRARPEGQGCPCPVHQSITIQETKTKAFGHKKNKICKI